MLSHKILTSANKDKVAKYYFDDYYSKEEKDGAMFNERAVSKWQGRGAKLLKLKGGVDYEKFQKLLSGDITLERGNKNIKARKSTRKSSSNRIGIDFTFSAPKSVSMHALITRDKRVLAAHDRAVKYALELAEKQSEARKKIKGKSQVEKTKNLIVAKFRHETSRELDPQLHTHAVIMNLTVREDGRWVALKNDEIIKMTKFLGAVYRSELALALQKMGYALRAKGRGFFELAHITQKQIEGFSRRSGQIEKELDILGLTRTSATTEQKQKANLKTRKHKTATKKEEILKGWEVRAKELGVNFDHTKYIEMENKKNIKDKKDLKNVKGNKFKDAAKAISIAVIDVVKLEAAKRAVRFAINHLTERESIIEGSTLLNTALKQSVGMARLPDINKVIAKSVKSGYLIQEEPLYLLKDHIKDHKKNKSKNQSEEAWIRELKGQGLSKTKAHEYFRELVRHGELVKSKLRYITRPALQREMEILQIEFNGRKVLPAIMQENAAWQKLELTNLNKGQREAALLMTTTTNRVVGIQGYAGTGKSHMLKVAKEMIEEEGYQIQALAPYGSQVKALQTLGIEAKTLASFLTSKDQNLNSRSVIIIDEAGVVPARQMEEALKLIETAGARVCLMGDKEQTKAVEAGKPFEQLQKKGMSVAYMDQIERQKHKQLKEAVELAARGNAKNSLKPLKRVSNIVEISDETERLRSIAERYTSLSEADRDKTIIVSGTNEARRYINAEIRKTLKEMGQLGGEVTSLSNETKIKTKIVERLINRNITRAEAEHARYYNVGDIISPQMNYDKIGMKQGELYEVEDNSSGNKLKVRAQAGDSGVIEFSPLVYKKFSIYELESAELAIGDTVRITRNNRELGLVNGDRLKVKDLGEDYIGLDYLSEDSTKSSTNSISKDKAQEKNENENENANEHNDENHNKNQNGNENKNKSIRLETKKPLHIDYAYATTVHSSQGLTCDRVLIDINTTSLTTTKDVYYVAISRARLEAQIYTNSKADLPKSISRESTKSTALDMVQAKMVHEHEKQF